MGFSEIDISTDTYIARYRPSGMPSTRNQTLLNHLDLVRSGSQSIAESNDACTIDPHAPTPRLVHTPTIDPCVTRRGATIAHARFPNVVIRRPRPRSQSQQLKNSILRGGNVLSCWFSRRRVRTHWWHTLQYDRRTSHQQTKRPNDRSSCLLS